MANRRKFIAGLGALATGSAAAMGTGAFTSVEANRTVDINAAGDASAYLALSAVSGSENSEYVTSSGGEVAFDFSSSNDGDGELGSGFNVGAKTQINDLLAVTNQGTQDVSFWVEAPYDGTVTSYLTLEASDYKSSSEDFSSTDSVSSGLIGDSSGSGASSATLSPGDTIYLHLEVDSTSTDTAHGPFNGQTITFHADATSGSSGS